jgi:hypothetical protein
MSAAHRGASHLLAICSPFLRRRPRRDARGPSPKPSITPRRQSGKHLSVRRDVRAEAMAREQCKCCDERPQRLHETPADAFGLTASVLIATAHTIRALALWHVLTAAPSPRVSRAQRSPSAGSVRTSCLSATPLSRLLPMAFVFEACVLH